MSFNPFDSVIGGILGDNPVDKIFKRIIKKSRWSRREPIKGDHIRVNRGFYYHHGIYVNDNEVIHYNTYGAGDGLSGNAKVMCTSLYDFLENGTCEVRNYSVFEKGSLYSGESIVKRAKGKLGKRGYNLVFNNCEHFANWCATGKKKSEQVEDFFERIDNMVNR